MIVKKVLTAGDRQGPASDSGHLGLKPLTDCFQDRRRLDPDLLVPRSAAVPDCPRVTVCSLGLLLHRARNGHGAHDLRLASTEGVSLEYVQASAMARPALLCV